MFFIEHNGKQILFHDFANCNDRADAMARFAESREKVARHEPRSLLTLTDVSNSRFDAAVVEAMKDVARHNKPFVRHAAIVGLSGLQRIIYVTVMQLTGRRMHTFESADKAKDWLAAQD